MQKKLIALAIAGLVSAPAFAQSNVTVYGVVDAGVGVGSSDDQDFRGVVGGVLSGNRLGFKGSEDLGNGLKAVFTLEYALSIDTNHGIGNNPSGPNARQTFVGLQGAFGTVSLGRQYAPGYFAGYDAALSSNVSPQSLFSAGAGLTITPNSPARWNNSVAYTGTFGGLTARAIYSAGDTEDTTKPGQVGDESPAADDKWGIGLDYTNGPLKVGAVYQYLKQARNDDQREWYVGGEYNFGVLTLAGSYQAGNDVNSAGFYDGPDAGTGLGDDRDVRLWNVGVIVPVSAAGKVHVDYGRLTEKDADKADGKSWTLAYTHALSKRTTGYVAYNRMNVDKGAYSVADGKASPNYKAGAAVGMVSGAGTLAAPFTAEDSNLFTVGMRHAF